MQKGKGVQRWVEALVGSDNYYSNLDGGEIGPDNFEDESDEKRARFEWRKRKFFLRICGNQLKKN